jgi:hypothetical protein
LWEVLIETTRPDHWLIGTQQLAWLHFSTVCTQSSAFVNLEIPDTIGTQPDGTLARNFAPQAGRVVVIGAEPLLEAYMGTNGHPVLVLYGQIGTNYVVQATADLSDPASWQTAWQGTLSDLFQVIEPVATADRSQFFPAVTP